MILARVDGSIVATKKHPKMTGSKLLVCRPLVVYSDQEETLQDGSQTIIAYDNLGAGEGEVVLLVQGSSARVGTGDKGLPVDATVVGIVDTVDIRRKPIYSARS